MAKTTHETKGKNKQFIGDTEPKAEAKAEPKVEEKAAAHDGDVLQHDARMAEQVEARVHEAVKTEVQNASPAVAADRLVDLASSTLLKAEVAKARVDEPKYEPPQQPAQEKHDKFENKERHQPQAEHGGARGFADALMHKAEERLDRLPAPVKFAGHLAGRAVGVALIPLRFGVRIAGEVVRTPVAFARLLLRSREA